MKAAMGSNTAPAQNNSGAGRRVSAAIMSAAVSSSRPIAVQVAASKASSD